MASSGKLAQSLSDALGLPESAGVVVLQALRAADMIAKRGRGSSAAEMTQEDAVVILTALASGAVSSQIADTTKLLLDMPHVMSVTSGTGGGALEGLRTRSLFRLVKQTSKLRDGLTAVMAQSFLTVEGEDVGEEGPQTIPVFNPMEDLSALSFTVGMDGRRTGGFAILKSRVSGWRVLTRFYSTWPVKNSVGGDRATDTDLLVDPFNVFDCGASLLTAARIDGAVFSAAVDCLAEPVIRTRQRLKRHAAR